MEYPSWQSSRKRTTYRRRVPEQTPLYRLIYHNREEFEYRYEELFQSQYGVLRGEVLDAFDKFLNCGILRYGAARARCEKCNNSILIAFSCKRRGVCASCQAKRAIIFAENLHQNILLPQPNRHIIFSLPKRLRIFFKFDRKLFGLLFRAAWESWNEYVSQQLPGGKTGAVMALHSAGELLHWHPHVHTLALDGVQTASGEFIQLPHIDAVELQAIFTEKVLQFLIERELITGHDCDTIIAQEHTGFNVYAAEPVAGDDQNARLFLARYLKKAPLAASRISIDESGIVPTVCYTKKLDDGEEETRKFSPLEFLAELSIHVPGIFEQNTRFMGVYSNRYRGAKRREEEYQQRVKNNFKPVEPPEEPTKPASQSWARAMKQVFEIDPLQCSRCGEQMKIIAFIHSPNEIEKIATHLGYNTWRAPPPFTTPSYVDSSPEYSQIQ